MIFIIQKHRRAQREGNERNNKTITSLYGYYLRRLQPDVYFRVMAALISIVCLVKYYVQCERRYSYGS